MAVGILSSINRNIRLDILAVLFGIGAWVAVNGLWVELPVLVEHLPESWNLPSYLTVVTQIANLGPLMYSLCHIAWPNHVTEVPVIYGLYVIGIASTLLLIFFWDATAFVGSMEHSVALLTLVFCLALMDCTSSVVFLPFMASFHKKYLTSYLTGEGLSGLLPSLVALAQGVGGNAECHNVSYGNNSAGNETTYHLEAMDVKPRFSTEAFFGFLFAMTVVSAIAFCLLNYLPFNKLENLKVSHNSDVSTISYQAVDNSVRTSESSTSSRRQSEASEIQDEKYELSQVHPQQSSKLLVGGIKTRTWLYLLALQAWISGITNGALLSVQSYSCLPYGNVAYHLSVTLANIANPLACFVAFFIPTLKVSVTTIHTTVATLVGSYIMALAVYSPEPPLLDSQWGVALVIIAWVLCIGSATYAKTAIANILRFQGGRALFWLGVATQIGALIGAVVMFVLVNVYKLFKSYIPC